MAELPTDPDALVRTFCAAFGRLEVDELLDFFAEEAVYHNIPLEPAVGRDAIRAVIEMFVGMASEMSFEIHRQVAADGLVLNERTDTMVIGEKTIALPVAGAFEVVDGKIAAWRDYFYMGQFTGA